MFFLNVTTNVFAGKFILFFLSLHLKVWNVNSELIQIKIMKIKQHLARLVPL